MSMFDGDRGWNGFGPQPVPQPEPVPAAPEPVPDVPAVPEPQSDAGPAEPKAVEARPRPKRSRPAFAWTADRVRQAREALALLDDGRTRRVVASAVDVDADDADRLALAVLKGGLSAPVGLLVAWHDETDPLRRAILVGQALEKDVAGSVKPTGSSPTDLQYALASAAPGLDVDAVRGLV